MGIFCLVILLHTSFGYCLLEQNFEDYGVPFEDARETCKLLLSWYQFAMDFNSRRDIIKAIEGTYNLQRMIKEHFPREMKEKEGKEEGSMGLHIPKVHCIPRLIANILKFVQRYHMVVQRKRTISVSLRTVERQHRDVLIHMLIRSLGIITSLTLLIIHFVSSVTTLLNLIHFCTVISPKSPRQRDRDTKSPR